MHDNRDPAVSFKEPSLLCRAGCAWYFRTKFIVLFRRFSSFSRYFIHYRVHGPNVDLPVGMDAQTGVFGMEARIRHSPWNAGDFIVGFAR